ncbi:MAG: hypothetical protein VB081_10610 [Christensenella sp.]|nr:hypothetical protein [Christensenella sp.]
MVNCFHSCLTRHILPVYLLKQQTRFAPSNSHTPGNTMPGAITGIAYANASTPAEGTHDLIPTPLQA